MIEPGRIAIRADRHVACIRSLPLVGLDLTGATFALQVRDRVAGGALRADLTTVTSSAVEGVRLIYGGTDTIANHIAAGRIPEVPPGINPATGVAYASTDSVAVSILGIRINETTMEAMPTGAELGDNVGLSWDMLITPSGGIKDRYFAGAFTLEEGTTDA